MFLQKCYARIQERDKVKVLDPYDGDVVGIGRIKSQSIDHGFKLSIGDTNVNILKAINNISLFYKDKPFFYKHKIDGCTHLKEKEESFTGWPLKYLEKWCS